MTIFGINTYFHVLSSLQNQTFQFFLFWVTVFTCFKVIELQTLYTICEKEIGIMTEVVIKGNVRGPQADAISGGTDGMPI